MRNHIRNALLVLVAAMLLVACSTKDSIVGKWEEIGDESEKMEFFKEGSLSVQSKGMDFAGKYSFVDDTRVKLELAGLPGALAGPKIFTVSLAGGELALTDANGKVSKYRRLR